MLEHHKDCSFHSVALGLILAGAAIFAFSVVAWYYNTVAQSNLIATPMPKAIGGLMVMGIGYIILELDFLRKK